MNKQIAQMGDLFAFSAVRIAMLGKTRIHV